MGQSPYTPLYTLKLKILDKLKDFLANTDNASSIKTLSISLDSIDLISLLPFLDHSQKILFCDREGDKQYLGIKFLKIFSSSFSINQAREYIRENPKLIILGGQKFHPNTISKTEWAEIGNQHYVIPQFIFVSDNKRTMFHININKEVFENSTLVSKLILDLDTLLTFKGYSQKEVKLTKETDSPKKADWIQQVNSAKRSIQSGLLQKVVLSRKTIFKADKPIKPDDLFELMKFRPGEHFIFHLQWRRDRSFTSMTPERLFKLEDSTIITDAIAGTKPRGKTKDEDDEYEIALKESSKELQEHRFVSSAVLETLKKVGCTDASIVGEAEKILKLKHVQHLYTKLSGHLLRTNSVSDLISAFHPTPAVGGTPKQEASDWLADNESYDRGLYASPVGVITANGADFCVAIRSALTEGDKLHVYAGAGIVEQSDPQSEWDETQSKMKNFTFTSNQKYSNAKVTKEIIDEPRSSH